MWLISSGHVLSVYMVLFLLKSLYSKTLLTFFSKSSPDILPGKYLSRLFMQASLSLSKGKVALKSVYVGTNATDALRVVFKSSSP